MPTRFLPPRAMPKKKKPPRNPSRPNDGQEMRRSRIAVLDENGMTLKGDQLDLDGRSGTMGKF